ncbi:MAG: hypothetical protein WKG00_20185 [Polyangiaceae bacterium]
MPAGSPDFPPALSKADTPLVDAVRGFVFLSGYVWLKKHGHGERYAELLPAHIRPQLGLITATEWIGIDDALSCYRACDELGLTVDEQVDVGRTVSAVNNGVVVATIIRLIGGLGASPWLGLRQIDRIWQRSNRGGAVAVWREARSTARLEFWKVPMARSRFFTTSMRGAIAVGIEPLCERVLVTELPEHSGPDGFALRVSW